MRTFFFILLVGTNLFAQPQFITTLYPPQHGLNIPADAVLRVGLQAPLAPTSLSDSSIYVWSDITGLHKLTVTLENGNKNLHIAPRHWRLNDRPAFNTGERVTVTLTTRLRYADGRPFEGFTWHYTVAVRQFRGGDFSPLVAFGGGGSTYFYASDFNGDGWCDLIGNDEGVQRKMIVFINDGKGALRFNHIENIISPSGGETADIDRDGDQEMTYAGDYLLFNDGGVDFLYIGGSISEKINPGFAIFQATAFDSLKILQVLQLPYEQRNFYGNDLDGDGDIDYIFIPGDSSGYFFINSGKGQLKPSGITRDKFYQTIEGGDLDGDGDIDLACVRSNLVSTFPERYAPDVSILLNDGKGIFSLASRFRLPFERPLNGMLRAVDLDADGDLDLIGVANGLFYIVSNGAYPNAVAQQPSSPSPLEFSLTPIYPNPVKSKAKIELKVPKGLDEEIIVNIFNINGRVIQSWRFNGRQALIRFTWDTRDKNANPLPNGIYFVQARAGQLRTAEKLLILN